MDWDPELDIAHHAIATFMLSFTVAASAETELAKNDGVPSLKDFRVCDTCIGHVCMHTIRAIPLRTGTGAASDGLVVSETLHFLLALDIAAKTEGQIVAVALACCTGLESFQHDIRHALAGEDVAADYGCRAGGREEGFLWNFDCDGSQAALVEWDVFAD